MDLFGLGKVGSTIVIMGTLLGAGWGAVKMFDNWVATGKEDAIISAAQASKVEALETEALRIAEQSEVASKELQVLIKEMTKIRDESHKLKGLMQRNWTDELQRDPKDFVRRANIATAKQLQRAQSAMDESIASTSGLREAASSN